MGTPLYTAPEQWLSLPCTGTLYAVMHGHLQAPAPSMSAANPLIPTPIEVVILRALAKDPAPG